MITYIMNDVMDGKNGYKPEYEEEYRKLTQDLWNQIDQTLACHGKTGEKLSTCFQKNYQALDSYWIRQSKGRVPKVWEISDPTQLQELYEERLTCYDTLRIVGECAEIITTDEIKESNQRSALITAIREFNSLSQHIQKLNDAADLNTDIKRNAGADWRNGEITKLTMGFHGFHHHTKEYLTYRDKKGITGLEDDIKDGNIQKIDRLMCREGAYQAVLDDIAETRRKSVKVMHRMRSINYQHPTDDWHKALSPMQQSFLFKKLEIYFENNILEALETKIAAFNNKKNSQETSRGM